MVMKFNDQPETKIGDIGEEVINEYLVKSGFILYKPINNEAHLIDGFAVRSMKDIFAFDVKTKPRRLKYEDTGIDISHYERYKYITTKYKIPVFLFFVDGLYKKVYGNYLSVLEQECGNYPLKQKGIIYFPLNKMIIISELPDDISDTLIIHSNRNYDY